jgi:predicted permease
MRRWLRHPAQTIVQVLSLGIGLAVCLTAYTALDALSFSPIPGIADRPSLVRMRWAAGPPLLSPAELDRGRPFFDRAFSALAVEGDAVRPIVTPAGAATVKTAFVSPAYFDALGTLPGAGRLLSASDATPIGTPPAVISDALWERAFNRAPIDGRQTVAVSDRDVTVVGVAPKGFPGLTQRDVLQTGMPDVDIWLPLSVSIEWRLAPAPAMPWLMLAGRLPLHETVAAVQPFVRAAASAMADGPGGRREPVFQAFAAGGSWSDDPVRATLSLGLFLFVPLCVLAIACANTVNLQLARAHERSAELAIRLALGSSRAALVRLLAADTIVVAVLSTLAAMVVTRALAIASEGALEMPLTIRAGVIVLAGALSSAIVVISGVAPAWIAARETVAGTARQHATEGVRHQRVRLSLVGLQLVVCTAMLFVSAVGVRSLARLMPGVPGGAFRTAILDVRLDQAHTTGTTPATFVASVLAGLRAAPTIEEAAVADFDVQPSAAAIRDADAPRSSWRTVQTGRVSTRWFHATDARLIRGREFARDTEPGVVIVNGVLARRLGETVHVLVVRNRVRALDERRAIVGVVDTPMLRADEEAVFLPLPDDPPAALTVVARGHDPRAAVNAIGEVVRRIDPRVPVDRVVTLADAIDGEAGTMRQVVWAGGIVSAAATFMAAVGIYALMAYSVQRRTREIGIRVAMGAGSAAILRYVLREALVTSIVGIGAGVIAGAGVVAAMRSAFFGLSPTDPAAFWPVVSGLMAVTIVASAVPALRATRVDPLIALRTE